jgi:hypothetical protein
MTNKEKFSKSILDVRTAWGLRTSTFSQICQLIGIAIAASIESDIDQEFAQTAISAMWMEWTEYRAAYFLLKSPDEVAATIVRWPSGKHYYVNIHGKGVQIQEKFNRVQDAESFMNGEIKNLERQGKTIKKSIQRDA